MTQSADSALPADYDSAVFAQSLHLWDRNSAEGLHRAISTLSDDEWAEVLVASVGGSPYAGYLLPRFIDAETQRMFVGSSGAETLREAQKFIRVVLQYASSTGISFNEETKVIDFGSGWGRFTRFMLKYIHPNNLYALEVNDSMVEFCRKSFGMANFHKIQTMPPCDLRDNLVDLVFGYSVFSHLSPDCADAWIAEFARILRPGGIVIMTTQGRNFIDYCQSVRDTGDLSHPWFVSLSQAFTDVALARSNYDAGQFLHHATGQLGNTYGESLIPPGYIDQKWSEKFELVDFVDDRQFLPQALFVLRRR